MYPVVITDAALSDLDSAIRYIALTLENPSAAAKMLDDFDNLAATLEDGAEGFLLVRDEAAAPLPIPGKCFRQKGKFSSR